MTQVWVVDDDRSVRFVVERGLRRAGHQVRCFGDLQTCRSALTRQRPDLLITDIRLEDGSGLELLKALSDSDVKLPVIVITAFSNLDNAVAAYQGGAFEYLAKPFDIQALQEAVQRALQLPAVTNVVAVGVPAQAGMVGQSSVMQELFRTIGRLSTTDVNVLISGETGCGKELVAEALHQHSPRASGQFVAINSAAVPSELLESELFGHERGAFTGAVQRHAGRFEQAQHGTLFLDEIGDMPLPLQARLLRVLAEGDYYRVGGRDLLKADVRVIAATHQDLDQLVSARRFRADLFHRLNVVQIRVPPLRERRSDIPLLAEYFLQHCAQQLNLEQKYFAPESMALLGAADWPGNVRELRNLCQHLSVLAPGEAILPADLPAKYQAETTQQAEHSWQQLLRQTAMAAARNDAAGLSNLREATRVVLMECALAQSGGRVGEAAQRLGIGRNTLSRWMKQYALAAGAKKLPDRR